MKRFISVFLCLILCFSIVVPVSASGLDPDTNGYSFDALPYLDTNYVDTSSIPIGGAVHFRLSPPDLTNCNYFYGYLKTDDPYPRIASSAAYFNLVFMGDNLFYFHGSFNRDYTYFPIAYYKDNSSSFLNFLTFHVSPIDYITSDLSVSVTTTGSYSRRNITTYETININGTNILSTGDYQNVVVLPDINADGTTSYPERTIFLTSVLTFNWTAYDRVDIAFYNGYDTLTDYMFHVDGINVLESIQSGTLNGSQTTIVTLDFSVLDPNINSSTCTIRMRGYQRFTSSSSQHFFIHRITGFSQTVSNNFWPSWLMKIINKLDNIFTGREEDHTAADSFQDTVDEQASQFEDMSNTMNQVERPDIESIDLSTSNMVDTDSVILATNGIGTILENPIILRVILMALTLALAGFVLYGKR